MGKIGCVAILFTMFYWSCRTNVSNDSTKTNTNDTVKFFQVKQFFQSQIRDVNATPFFIYKVEIIDGIKDSTHINNPTLNEIAKQYLNPDINDEQLKPSYTESIFEDQTTKGFTINYSTKNKELELQSVDILLSEDGQTVKRIFLRKYYNYPDSSAIEQLSWKPGESFQVNRSVQKQNANEILHQTTVVWNKKI